MSDRPKLTVAELDRMVAREIAEDSITKTETLPAPMFKRIAAIVGDEKARAVLEEFRHPTRQMLLALILHDWPHDWQRGKDYQIEHGLALVGPNTETEVTMGRYQLMIDAALKAD